MEGRYGLQVWGSAVVGQESLVGPRSGSSEPQEATPSLVWRNESLHSLADQCEPCELLGSEDSVHLYAHRRAECAGLGKGLLQFVDKRILVPDGGTVGPFRSVDGERPLKVLEDADVVDYDTSALAGGATIGPSDGLHQRVVLHRLVQIDRATCRHIKAGDPHGADEHEPQRVV